MAWKWGAQRSRPEAFFSRLSALRANKKFKKRFASQNLPIKNKRKPLGPGYSSLSRQSSETKPRTNLLLVSREPMHCLEFNKPSKQNVSEINLFKKFNFSLCQNNFWHADWCQEWNIKTSLLKISKIKYITLLSDANVPVRFIRAQQRAKYS